MIRKDEADNYLHDSDSCPFCGSPMMTVEHMSPQNMLLDAFEKASKQPLFAEPTPIAGYEGRVHDGWHCGTCGRFWKDVLVEDGNDARVAAVEEIENDPQG